MRAGTGATGCSRQRKCLADGNPESSQRETSEENREALFKRKAPLRSKLRSDQRNTAGSLPNNHRKRLTETRRTEELLVGDRRLREPSGFNRLPKRLQRAAAFKLDL